MTAYKRIIVAIDLAEDCAKVVQKALLLSAEQDVQFILAHVLEPVALAYGGDIPTDMSDIQEQIQQSSLEHIEAMAQQFAIEHCECRVITGHPEVELEHLARRENADLMVVGSHSKTGLKVLFGGTASSLLNHSPCDVLAVRI